MAVRMSVVCAGDLRCVAPTVPPGTVSSPTRRSTTAAGSALLPTDLIDG